MSDLAPFASRVRTKARIAESAHLELFLFRGGMADEPESCLWLAGSGCEPRKLTVLEAEAKLNESPLAGRPLHGGRIHCMVALQYGNWKSRDNSASDAAGLEYQRFVASLIEQTSLGETGLSIVSQDVGRNYYLPHLHPLLVPTAPTLPFSDPIGQIVTLRSNAFENCRLECRKTTRGPVFGQVEDVFLHLGAEKTVLLEWVLTLDAKLPEVGDLPLWQTILAQGSLGPSNSLAAWLDYSAAVRTCYSAYAPTRMEIDRKAGLYLHQLGADNPEELISLHAGLLDDRGQFRVPIIGLVERLLRAFVSKEEHPDLNAVFEGRFDERARVVQSVLVAGQEVAAAAPDSTERAICETRLLGVDNWEPGFPYAEAFSRAETGRHAYDRFVGMGSRWLIADHCFAYIGFGGFAHSQIWPSDMRHLYPGMARLLHLNGAILNGFSRALGQLDHSWPAGPRDDYAPEDEAVLRFTDLKGRYLRFLSLNWFELVSSQMQGIELYDLLRGASQAQRELRIVGESIERGEAFLGQRENDRAVRLERRKEDLIRFIALAGTFAGLAGLYLALVTSADGSWLKSALGAAHAGLWNGTQGALLEWRFEVAAYGTMAIMVLVARLGLLRLPGQERARPVKRRLLAAGLALSLAAPWIVQGMASGATMQAALAVLLALASGLLVARARPEVLRGARREYHAGWLLMASLVGLITAMAGLHVAFFDGAR